MRFSPIVLVAAVAAGIVSCAPHTDDQTTSAQQTGAPASESPATATPSPRPSAVAPSAVPAAAVTPLSAAHAPSAVPAAIVAAPNDAPRIVNVRLSETTVHGGDTVSGTIVTSSNVASVELRIGGFSMNVPKDGVGRFAMNYTVPNLPFFLHRTYDMTLIARNTRGDRSTKIVPIAVQ